AGDGRRRDRGCPESGRRGRWPAVRREGWTSRARDGRLFRRATYIEWGCVPTSTSYRYIIYIVSRKKCAGNALFSSFHKITRGSGKPRRLTKIEAEFPPVRSG